MIEKNAKETCHNIADNIEKELISDLTTITFKNHTFHFYKLEDYFQKDDIYPKTINNKNLYDVVFLSDEKGFVISQLQDFTDDDFSSQESQIVDAFENGALGYFWFGVDNYDDYFISPDKYYCEVALNGSEIQTASKGQIGYKIRQKCKINNLNNNNLNMTDEYRLYTAIPFYNNFNNFIDSFKGIYFIMLISVDLPNYTPIEVPYYTFLYALLVLLLSIISCIIFYFSINKPLISYKKQAMSCLDQNGRIIYKSFKESKRKDEIGNLARTTEQLIHKVNKDMNNLDTFSSDVTHEFKNPLSSIKLCAEYLQQFSIDQENINKLHEESNHISLLLKDMNDISSMSLNYKNQEKIPIIPIITTVIKRISLSYPSTDIYFEEPTTSIYLSISEENFDRIMENIIDNAASFATLVMVNISITDSNIQITVEDNGKGIPDIEKTKIFERFYSNRDDKDLKSKHTGIGLATVKVIVELFNGIIQVEDSSILGGAKFIVTFNRGECNENFC